MRVLVLGGNRYIGVSLVAELARRGHEVTVANSHPTSLPDGVERLHVDRRAPGELVATLAPRAESFNAVFDNTAYEVADLAPLVELFDGRVSHYVFTSSVAVYRRSFIQPVAEGFRVHEEVADQPLRAYGVGKVRCEHHLLDRHRSTGFPATAVRVTHTIGPRSPLASREPAFFARLEAGRPVLIPGDGFPFVHPIHIDDVARLLASLLGNRRAEGQIYNAAGPEFASVLGCIEIMAGVVGVEANIVHVPPDVVRRLPGPLVHWGEATAGGTVFSIAKALDHLDWAPRLGLEDAYRDSYQWFAASGRDAYQFDFSLDDEALALLGTPSGRSPEGPALR